MEISIQNPIAAMYSMDIVAYINDLRELDSRLEDVCRGRDHGQEWFIEVENYVKQHPALSDLPNIRNMLYDFVLRADSAAAFARVARQEGEFVDTLYVMWSESMQAVKIGRTRYDPKLRVSALRTGCPDIEMAKTFPGMGKFEARLHKKLSEFCIGGEWFSVTPEIAIQAVESIEG